MNTTSKSDLMKNVEKLIIISSMVLVLASCTKKPEVHYTPSPGLGGDVWAQGPIDKWMYDSLTKPYNIAVKYRWDPWEVNIGADLVPPEEDRVIPALEAMKRIWIDPYNAETGSDAFIRKYAPKQFIMVGSAEYMSNGNMLLGQAEGGKKIAMYVINNFSTTNIEELRRMLHTIEHEFAHILHQTVMYPEAFKSITPDYTGTWFNMSNAEAQSRGFTTNYARSNPDDDFVETVATMLIEGKNRWEELVKKQNAAAQAALRKKEAMVVDYFRNTWKIDFYSLQKRTQDALNSLSPDPIEAYIGFDKTYQGVFYDPSNTSVPSSASGFVSVYNQAKANVQSFTNNQLTISGMAPVFVSANSMELYVFLYRASDQRTFVATYTFNFSRDASGIYRFTYVSANDPNGPAFQSSVTPLLDYFRNNSFKVEWYQQSPNNTYYPKVIFTPQQTSNAYFIGVAAS